MGASFSMNISIRAPAGACSHPERRVLGLGIENQHETAAPKPGTLGLHQPQHGVGGNGCIHRVAALREHLRRCRRGIGIGHRGHPTVRPGGRLRLRFDAPGKQPKAQHKGRDRRTGSSFRGGKVKGKESGG